MKLREQHAEIARVFDEFTIAELVCRLPVDKLVAAFDDVGELSFRTVFEFVVVSDTGIVGDCFHWFKSDLGFHKVT